LDWIIVYMYAVYGIAYTIGYSPQVTYIANVAIYVPTSNNCRVLIFAIHNAYMI